MRNYVFTRWRGVDGRLWSDLAVRPDARRKAVVTPLGPERRSALGILADAPRGLIEAMLTAHGVTGKLIAGLVRDGLATVQAEHTIG